MIYPFFFLVGYDILSVAEHDRERFVNLCSQAGISYRIMGFEGQELKIRVTLYSSLRLRLLCEKYKIEVKRIGSYGLPNILSKILSRGGLVLGSALCVLMVVWSGRIVWDVRIEGNSEVPEQHIIDTLSECGFGVGSQKEGLELDKIENRFLILTDEISWISVNIRGTVASVEVREAVVAQKENDYAASNLVAAKNGTIVGFEQVKGNIAVEIGEAVSSGELLVGGVYGSENSSLRFVRSRGKVLALCDTELSVSVPMTFEKKVYTGRQKIKKSLIFFKKEVNFFVNSGNSYTSCDTIEGVEYFDILGLGKIPIGIRTVSYVEYTVQTATRSEAEAQSEAQHELWQMFYSGACDAELVKKTLSGTVLGDTYILTANIKSIENIAIEKQIELNITG
ncbi:MAG: sporulation protein YqfD [Clostridia bacterium]|nr:sporulation protein YqfD [Clostridia bacterium]